MSKIVITDSELEDVYPGLLYFMERFGYEVFSAETIKAYERWQFDKMLDRLDEERRVAEIEERLAEREIKGKAECRAKGKADTQM